MELALEAPFSCGFEGQIRQQTGGLVRDLKVHQDGESVVLQGYTRTFYAKQLAQEAARRISTLLRVRNEIVVCR